MGGARDGKNWRVSQTQNYLLTQLPELAGPAWLCSSCLYLIIPRAASPRQDPSYLIMDAALIVGECFLMSCQNLPPHVFSPLFFMVSLEQHSLTQLPLPLNSPLDSWSQLSWLPLDTVFFQTKQPRFPYEVIRQADKCYNNKKRLTHNYCERRTI